MGLYENFNTTNQTSPHFERHENLLLDPIRRFSCARVESLPEKERCSFVQNHEPCKRNVRFINYMEMYYCSSNSTNEMWRWLGIGILLCLLFYYCWILTVISRSYFCPALQTLAQILHLSENVAGVTLLAFGNGAPDLFASIVSWDSPARNPYSDTYAANLFINLVVAGSIIAINPFVVEPEFFLRDTLFMLLDVVYMDYTIKTSIDGITVWQAFGVPIIYVCYIIFVIMDQWLMLKKKRVTKPPEDDLRRTKSFITMPTYRKSTLVSVTYESSNAHLLQQFFESINPLDVKKFCKSSIFGKILALFKIPITFALRIIIPYVDCTAPNYGWSKLLCCLQYVITPTFVAVGYWQPWLPRVLPLLTVLTLPLTVVAFLFSRTDVNPSYYKYISILSILTLTTTIYAIAGETLILLEVLGITLHCSDAIIGSTILPWGNGIGDLVSNIALSKQGYPRMAYAACFGAPVFNSFCCIGIPLVYKMFTSPDINYLKMTEGTLGENASIFLIIGLFSTIIYGLANNFMMRRYCGIFNIVLYGIYLVHAFLSEFNVIHPYGTDHTLDRRIEDFD